MEVTLESLKIVESSIAKILKEDLPIRISYKLSKLYELLLKEMERVEDLRRQLVIRYGEEVDGVTKVTEANTQEFNKEYGELMREAVDVGTYEPIPVQQLLDYSKRAELMSRSPISLSALDIRNLMNVGILTEQGE